MSTSDPSVVAAFAHHHPGLVVIGCVAAGIYGTAHEIKRITERKARNPEMGAGAKEVMGAVSMLPAAAVVAGMLIDANRTEKAVAVIGGALGVCWGIWMLVTRERRRHHRIHCRPLHQAVADAAGHDERTRWKSYLKVRKDLSEIRVRMTHGAAVSLRNVERVKHAVTQTLQLGECEISENLHGMHPVLVFRPVEAPAPIPGKVKIKDVLPRLKEFPGPKQIVQGVAGDGELVVADFSQVVHELISARTGSGKSNKTTFTLMQLLHKGAVAIIVDPTGVSYPWAQRLPNVFYAKDDADVRKACYWVGEEIKRRDRFVRDQSDISGFVEGGFGPDLIIVADEKNLAERRLNADYQASGGKGRDPALQTLDEVHFAGRKIAVHAVMPMVRGDARAAGGGTVRGQAGLITFKASPAQAEWDMFFRNETVPVSKDVPVPPGRMQVCFGGAVHEVQVPHCLEVPGQEASPKERAAALEMARIVRDYAISGIVTPVPDDLLEAEYPDQDQDKTFTDQEEHPGPGSGTVSLQRIFAERLTSHEDIEGLRTASKRPGFPAPLPERGPRGEKYYRRADIIAWESARIGQAPENPGNVVPFRSRREENAPS